MRFIPVLGFTDGDVWRPGIGDPTVMGWITVIAYFGVAALCLGCARTAWTHSENRAETIFWSGLSALLVLLGANKQLDLQTWLTLTARRLAIAQGWYEYRRVVQVAFVAVLGLSAVAAFGFMWQLVRTQSRDLSVSLIGFVLLLTFVIVRAASFHHIDTLINFRLAGVRMNWVLELGAIVLIALGAAHKIRTKAAAPRNIVTVPS